MLPPNERERPFLESKKGIKILFGLILGFRFVLALVCLGVQVFELVKYGEEYPDYRKSAWERCMWEFYDMCFDGLMVFAFWTHCKYFNAPKLSWWAFPSIALCTGLLVGALASLNGNTTTAAISEKIYLPSYILSWILAVYMLASTVPLLWCMKKAGDLKEQIRQEWRKYNAWCALES